MFSVFIRASKRDLARLEFYLQSIHQNRPGWNEIPVGILAGQAHDFRYAEGVCIVTCQWADPPDVPTRRWPPIAAKLCGKDAPVFFMLRQMTKDRFSPRWLTSLSPLNKILRGHSQSFRRPMQWLKSGGVILP